MECLDYWRLCDELTVVQAALLIIGEDPQDAEENLRLDQGYPNSFHAVFAALKHAIIGGRLPSKVRRKAWERGWTEPPEDEWEREAGTEQPGDEEKITGNFGIFPDQERIPEKAKNLRDIIYRTEPDWHLTTILEDDLREWLKSRGLKTGFFFPQADDTPDYLDKNHEHYAPKLAAAISAWQTVNAEPDLLSGKTVKQALTIWLRKNAGQYGLTKDDGNPNEQGIEEIAKISNWDVKGGAPKTPG